MAYTSEVFEVLSYRIQDLLFLITFCAINVLTAGPALASAAVGFASKLLYCLP
jgi:hypothetical protein